MFRIMKLGRYVTVDDSGNLCHVSVDLSIYYKNPELCSLRCGDEFVLELNWNGALNPVYYNSVEELGRLACFKCLFFRFEQDHFRIEYVAFSLMRGQYSFSAESYNQYLLCVRITLYPRAV